MLDTRVVAVSIDDVSSQRAMADRERLGFPLLADEHGRAARLYGVERGAYARRVSFLVDPQGRVRYVDEKVRVSRHGRDLVERLREMR